MNKKEADDIAWELYQVMDTFKCTGPQCAELVANAAFEAVSNILHEHPKIAEAFKVYQPTEE